MQAAQAALAATRPTAVNLHWALSHCAQALQDIRYAPELAVGALLELAQRLRTEDIAQCRAIGEHGLAIIREVAARKPGQPVRVLTHCNAGWLGCVDYGTATAPLYLAHDAGIPLEVWVDETRPRNQGSNLTAWELGQHGIPHHLIVDNTGGHLMQHGLVDLCIVGTDRVTRTGDVANKIGTYLKALAAKDNGVPFYVAAPSSSIDFELTDGIREIPIETRSPDEVRYVQGWADGRPQQVRICPEDTPAVNYGFDVTPARLVSALITERGVCLPIEEKISTLFADRL
jgi:methylthioribose-1-phosphate isomerase